MEPGTRLPASLTRPLRPVAERGRPPATVTSPRVPAPLTGRSTLVERLDPKGVVSFWCASIGVSLATFGVLALLARRLDHGELAQVASVLGLSFVAAILPAAVQVRAATRQAQGHAAFADRIELRWVVVGGVALAPVVGMLTHLPVLAVACVALQLVPAVQVSVGRGRLIGTDRFRAVAGNYALEAVLRLGLAVTLGVVFGVTGVAAGLALATTGAAFALVLPPALVAGDRVRGDDDVLRLADNVGTLVALGLMTLSVHLDSLSAPGVLGPIAADAYDVAAVPAKGVFIVLMAAGWIVIPRVVRGGSSATHPVVATVAAGIVLAVGAAVCAPIAGAVLGRATPTFSAVLVPALAMAAAAGVWVGLQTLLASRQPRPWLAPAATVAGFGVVIVVGAPQTVSLGLLLLVAQMLGLAVVLVRLRVLRPEAIATTPAEAAAGLTVDLREGASAVAPPAAAPRRHLPSPRPRRHHVSPQPRRSGERQSLITISVLLLAACLIQQPGRTVSETKLDLVLDPGGFLSRAMHLWEPLAYFGHVQNQSVGYLFPMGPFALLGEVVGAPPWITQRLWMALLLVVPLWGVVKVAEELEIGDAWSRTLGALAYVLSPIFLARVGTTSGMVIGTALMPWILLPLIRGARQGSTRRAAALSGLGVLAIGGINAAVTLGALAVPAIFLLTRARGPRRASLMRWWVLSVVLATAWWAIPLLFQLRYGFNFLPYTERAATTTAFTSLTEVVRGTADWLSYLHLSGPWLPGGWTMVSHPFTVVATALVAAAGLAGLARRDLPERTFLVACFVSGVAVMVAAYGSFLGNPLADVSRELLDGPAGMIRNVFKFDPVVRLPIVLGLAHVAAIARARVVLRLPRLETVFNVAVAVVVVLAALPLVRNELVSDRGFVTLPDEWREVAAYLDEVDASRALLVPGLEFGDYRWGRTGDEPLQALAATPWAVRSLIPLGGEGSIRLLDSIEDAVGSGETAGLAPTLARSGVTHVVVRNNLDWERWGAPRPLQVREALVEAGLTREAVFGAPLAPIEQPTVPGGVVDLLAGPEAPLHVIEVYRVGSPEQVVGPVQVYDVNEALIVSGGPEAVLELAEGGINDRAVVLAGDLPSGGAASEALTGAARWVVTDTLQREHVDFGLQRNHRSYVLAAGEDAPGGGAAAELLPFPADDHQTVAASSVPGVHGDDVMVSMRASSSGSWLLQVPEVAPSRAFDGDLDTAWVTGAPHGAEGEWVEIRFAEPVDPTDPTVSFLADGPWRPQVTAVEVTTAAGTERTEVEESERVQSLAVPEGKTTFVRLTLTDVAGDGPASTGAGIRELTLPGLPVRQTLVVPSDVPSASRPQPTPVFRFERARQPGWSILRSDEETELARQFTLDEPVRTAIGGTVVASPGPALDDLLAGSGDLRVATSSTWQDLPRFRPGNLLDGNPATAWIARPSVLPELELPDQPGQGFGARQGGDQVESPVPSEVDPQPEVRLRWPGEREISTVQLVAATPFPLPDLVEVATSRGSTTVVVDDAGVLTIPPTVTDELTLRFLTVDPAFARTGFEEDLSRLPVGLAEIQVAGLRDLDPELPDPDDEITVGCDQGPTVSIDGVAERIAVTASVSDLTDLRPLEFSVCGAAGAAERATVDLAAGSHELRTDGSSSPVSVATVHLGGDALSASAPADRSFDILSWEGEERRVRVSASDQDALLAVNENANDGWEAKLDGQVLEAVRLDGWRQGYLIPAGMSGDVELRFVPGASYRWSLLAGALLVLALLALALAPADRRRSERLPACRSWAPSVRVVTVVGALLVAWVAGPVVLLLPIAVVLARRRPATLPIIAALCFGSAGLLAAAHAGALPGDGVGAFGWPAQLAASLALTAVVATVVSHAGRPGNLLLDELSQVEAGGRSPSSPP